MDIRIAAAAYALPPDIQTVDEVLASESIRVRQQSASGVAGLGLREVRVCNRHASPHSLALEAAREALDQAGLTANDLDIVIDFSTFQGDETEYVSFAQRVCTGLGVESALSFSFKIGGCAGLHLAIKTAQGLMAGDSQLRSALLVAADTPPAGSRSLLPVTVQGDAASAMVLRQGGGAKGPRILASEAITLSHLHDAITLGRVDGQLVIHVDGKRIEDAVKPVYFLNFHRLLHKALGKASLTLDQVHHIVYSNISRPDRDGFVRALRLPPERMQPGRLEDLGHTFASDLVINYADLVRAGGIGPGQTLLFASAGIGFTWGVTIAQAA